MRTKRIPLMMKPIHPGASNWLYTQNTGIAITISTGTILKNVCWKKSLSVNIQLLYIKNIHPYCTNEVGNAN